jgi:glycosyltransferase involved in cell wall biosynthesis
MKKLISIVTPCFNEEENINELCDRISRVFFDLPYDYEHIIIDNCSTDNTVSLVKNRIETDHRVRLIVNTRNFGHIRSPYHGVLQSSGDACILIASDLQDPPELLPQFLKKWEDGAKIVMAVKPESEENYFINLIRRTYYKILNLISDVPLVNNATGAGLFDKRVVEILRGLDDPYPYFRGLLCEIGYPITTVEFVQPKRKRGISKSNFFTLYDIGMLGVTSHSKVPLRLMTLFGFFISFVCFFISAAYFIVKILYWDSFELGLAPIVVGLFFIGAVQMFIVGLLGEYVGTILTQVRKLPLVTESERINFPSFNVQNGKIQ